MLLKFNLLKCIPTYILLKLTERSVYQTHLSMMLPEINAWHLMWQKRDQFIKSANHFVICRNKAIFGGAFKLLLIFVHSGGSDNSKLHLRSRAHASSWLEYVLVSCIESTEKLLRPVRWWDGKKILKPVSPYLCWACTAGCDLKTRWDKQTHEDRLIIWYSKERVLYAAWNVHSIYIHIMWRIYVYAVNGWIGALYLVMQTEWKSECRLWKLRTNFV